MREEKRRDENTETFFKEVERVSPLLQNDLHLIKQRFSSEVNSKRRLSLVTSFEDLVKVLIKRTYQPVTDRSISWLNRICQQYLSQPDQQYSPQQNRTCISNTNQAPSGSSSVQSPTLPSQIVDWVSRNMSRRASWKCLARQLDVKEGDITELDARYPTDNVQCTREVLRLYIQEMPTPTPTSIVERLEKALDAIQRPQLRSEVTAIARSLNI